MKSTDPFHGITPSGEPILHPGHIDPGEHAGIQQFLAGGGFVMGTRSKAQDLLDPQLGRVVPRIFKTDGEWLWSAGTSYYLRVHGAPPEPDFLQHIRDRGYTAATPDEGQLAQAIRLLQEEGARAAAEQSTATTDPDPV